MKIPDVNVLLAAHREAHPQFLEARRWLDELIEAGSPFSVIDAVAGSFLRISTNHRIFTNPAPLDEAFDYLEALRLQPAHQWLGPTARHLAVLQQLCLATDARGDLMPDAQLAAIAIEHGAEVVSYDRDFARFEEVRWSMPDL